jgi:hypothetical protein
MQMQQQSDRRDQQYRQQQSQQPSYYQPTSPQHGGGYAPGRQAAPPPAPPRTGAKAFGHEQPNDIANAHHDYKRAVALWRPLAERGDVNAEYNLGVMYEMGHGVPVNKSQAALWYRKAAENGFPAAMENLATLITAASRGPENLVSAYMWLRIAAERDPNDADAPHNMSILMRYMSYAQITRAENLARVWTPH